MWREESERFCMASADSGPDNGPDSGRGGPDDWGGAASGIQRRKERGVGNGD